MNLLELVGFSLLLALVIFSSGTLGRRLGIPEAVLIVPLVALLGFLLRLLTKLSSRTLSILLGLLSAVSFLSMGIAHFLRLREPVLAAPIAAGLVFIVIQSKLVPWRRGGASKRKTRGQTGS